jgi:uncharacterized RmlC-like cupin family protein
MIVDNSVQTGDLVIIGPDECVRNPDEQTEGMDRRSGVSPETTGSKNLWTGHVTTPGGTVAGAHHHGDAESAIYMLAGQARFRWGPRLEHERIAGPGDFIYVPPNTVHAEEALGDEDVVFVVSRNTGSMTTVNVDIEDLA